MLTSIGKASAKFTENNGCLVHDPSREGGAMSGSILLELIEIELTEFDSEGDRLAAIEDLMSRYKGLLKIPEPEPGKGDK